MPDLDIQVFAHCASNDYWNDEYPSSDGKTRYQVVYEELPPSLKAKTGASHGFRCNCKGFKFRQTCSHVKEAEKDHCGWMQFLHGGEPVEGKCPQCGEYDVNYMRWGV